MKYRYLINDLGDGSFYLWDRLLKMGWFYNDLELAVKACTCGLYIVG